jgi:uncharacterized protein
MLFNGKGVEQDVALALEWFRKSAQGGYCLAMNALGHIYDTGDGVEQDFQEAFRWFKMSADAGDDSGQNNVGMSRDRRLVLFELLFV